MRAAAGFHTDDAFRRQRARFGEDALIFFGIDVVSDHRQLPVSRIALHSASSRAVLPEPTGPPTPTRSGVFIRVHGFS